MKYYRTVVQYCEREIVPNIIERLQSGNIHFTYHPFTLDYGGYQFIDVNVSDIIDAMHDYIIDHLKKQ